MRHDAAAAYDAAHDRKPTLETPPAGLELGRLRSRRPERPPEPDHARQGAPGRGRGEGGPDLLPEPAAGPARRQRAQPASPPAGAAAHGAQRQTQPELPAGRRQPAAQRRHQRRPGA